MRINQSLESDLPFGCISLTLLFSFFSKWQNTCSWPFKVATNDAIFPFLHRCKKFGIGERSEISRSLEVSRTRGSTSTEPVNKDFEDNIALEETNKQTYKYNYFLFRTCKPREICWLCHAVILFPGISKENMLDHKNKLSDNNAFDTKLPSVPSNIFRIIWRISLRWQTEISSIAGARVLRILILSEPTTPCWLFKKTTRNEGLVHCSIRLIQRYKDHQNGKLTRWRPGQETSCSCTTIVFWCQGRWWYYSNKNDWEIGNNFESLTL